MPCYYFFPMKWLDFPNNKCFKLGHEAKLTCQEVSTGKAPPKRGRTYRRTYLKR